MKLPLQVLVTWLEQSDAKQSKHMTIASSRNNIFCLDFEPVNNMRFVYAEQTSIDYCIFLALLLFPYEGMYINFFMTCHASY